MFCDIEQEKLEEAAKHYSFQLFLNMLRMFGLGALRFLFQ
jgi:hypothetical protein